MKVLTVNERLFYISGNPSLPDFLSVKNISNVEEIALKLEEFTPDKVSKERHLLSDNTDKISWIRSVNGLFLKEEAKLFFDEKNIKLLIETLQKTIVYTKNSRLKKKVISLNLGIAEIDDVFPDEVFEKVVNDGNIELADKKKTVIKSKLEFVEAGYKKNKAQQLERYRKKNKKF